MDVLGSLIRIYFIITTNKNGNNNGDIMINNFVLTPITNLCFKFYHVSTDEWDRKLAKRLFLN